MDMFAFCTISQVLLAMALVVTNECAYITIHRKSILNWTRGMDGCAPISVRLFKSQTKYYSSSFAILQRGVRGLCISFCRCTSHHITVCRVDAFLLCTRAPAKWSSILARITSACITTSNIWKGNWLGLLNALAEPQQKPFNLPKH